MSCHKLLVKAVIKTNALLSLKDWQPALATTFVDVILCSTLHCSQKLHQEMMSYAQILIIPE
jgi:hypothetical protein